METINYNCHIARKQHKCDMCNRIINSGDKYHSSFIVDGGDHWQWKECIYCHDLVDILFTKDDLWDGIDQWAFEDMVWDRIPQETKDSKIPLSLAVELLHERLYKKDE